MTISALFEQPSMQALRLTMNSAVARHDAIASNVANINTPGYKRVDLSDNFQQQMSQAMESFNKGKSVSALPTPAIETAKIQNPARLDGNTVNLDQEMTGLMENGASYDFAARMLGRSYTSITTAISTRG